MQTYIRFERGRDGVIGPTLGPFDFVQITYNHLIRVGDGRNDDQEMAYFSEADGDWILKPAFQGDTESRYSDVIVWAGEEER